MRTFAVLIILFNLGYFVWNQVRQTESVGAVRSEQSLFAPAEKSLILLSERPPISVPILEYEEVLTESVPQDSTIPAQEAASEVAPAQVSQPEPSCYVVSGFDDQNETDTFITAISEMGVVGWRDIQQEQISSTWWVHLLPFKSQLEAQNVIDELGAKGIDNFYMRTGELAGGISLGVFSREQTATAAQSELSSRGYEASIKEIPRYVSKAYVLMEASDPLLLETLEWTAFLATKTKLEVTEKLCETIARQNQFP